MHDEKAVAICPLIISKEHASRFLFAVIASVAMNGFL